jgi:hypothetical protein
MKHLLWLAIVAFPLLTACEHLRLNEILGRDDNQEENDRRRLTRLRAEIDELIAQPVCDGIEKPCGTPACKDEENCRYIGIGAKPCGGPWEFLVYSTETVDEQFLRKQVTAYNSLEDKMNRTYGYASDCSLPNEPLIGCVEGRCTDLNRPLPVKPQDDLLPLGVVDSFEEVGTGDPIDIRAATISGDTLNIDIGHSGGCAEHAYALWTTRASTRSLPPQHSVRLTHQANGDMCEAYLQRTLSFSLLPLRRMHQGEESVTVILAEYDGQLEYNLSP